MATDPVESIHFEERVTPFSARLRPKLADMARLEPSVEHPYMSVYIDWRPGGENPGLRPGKRQLENKIGAYRRSLRDAGKSTDDFDAAVQRVSNFIDDSIDPAVHGVFILSNDALDVFQTILLAMPLDTGLAIAPTPALRQLATVVEDFPRYVVLHADQHDASVYVVSRASSQSEVSLESSEYPRRQSTGGWSQRRYQARQDQRIQHFARAVAEEVRRVLDAEDLDMLILAVGEVFGSALNDELHQSVKERIAGAITHQGAASETEIIAAAHQAAKQAERDREVASIRRFQDALGAGNRGAGGINDVLTALTNGQVMTLLMADDFEAEGWADYQMAMYGVGPVPSGHPAGGNPGNLTRIDLAEEFVRLALATGAGVEIVPALNAARLHEHKGVGAILRYPV